MRSSAASAWAAAICALVGELGLGQGALMRQLGLGLRASLASCSIFAASSASSRRWRSSSSAFSLLSASSRSAVAWPCLRLRSCEELRLGDARLGGEQLQLGGLVGLLLALADLELGVELGQRHLALGGRLPLLERALLRQPAPR